MAHTGKTKKKDFTTQKLLDAIKDSNGNMSVIAERLKCSWATARQYIGDDTAAKELYKGETERMLDKAEQIINDSLDQTTDHAEQLQTAKWLLATKGGNRGLRRLHCKAIKSRLTTAHSEDAAICGALSSAGMCTHLTEFAMRRTRRILSGRSTIR